MAAEIADLYQIDLHSIQIDLLKKWLSLTTQEPNDTLDETIYNNLNVSNVEDTSADDVLVSKDLIQR